MAYLSSSPNGRWQLQFKDASGKRKTLRLGKMTKRNAATFKTRIEYLLSAQISKQPIDTETARWLASLDDVVLTERLANAGLIDKRKSILLGEFINGYIQGRTDVKPATVIKYRGAQDKLVAFFGADCDLRHITAGDADDWRLFLLKRGLAETTVRKQACFAKQFFKAAVRKKLIDEDPFRDLKSTSIATPERFHFVSRADADKVFEACPDAEWRLIFALARYGGLRCPSEHLALTWDDVDWNNNRICVHSSKTEHHAGKASRLVPIFPELRPHLESVWDIAPEGTVRVINRKLNANLGTQMKRVIRRAGLAPWPKVFQNCRSTRETELCEEFPVHVVCQWIGNSQAVAAKHYLQVTDEHFARASATKKATFDMSSESATGWNTGCQQMTGAKKTPEMSVSDTPGHSVTTVQVEDRGLERVGARG